MLLTTKIKEISMANAAKKRQEINERMDKIPNTYRGNYAKATQGRSMKAAIGISLTEMNKDTEAQSRRRENNTQIDSVEITKHLCEKDLFRGIEDQIVEAISNTLPEKEGERNKCLFEFARYLKAIAELKESPADELRLLVELWHQEALPAITTKPFIETWVDFVYGWANVKFPKGEDVFEWVCDYLLEHNPKIPELLKYKKDKEIYTLGQICYALQILQQDEPFFIDCRTAGIIVDKSHVTAYKMLYMLVTDGVLKIAERGNTRKATRYWFVSLQPGSLPVN